MRRDNPYKSFIKVRVDFELDGRMTPLMFKTEHSRTFKIDRLLDVRIAASLRAGGQGERYTVEIEGRELYLWLDGAYWFIENAQLAALD